MSALTTYKVYFATAGVPTEGLTPTWQALRRVSDGADLSGSAPAISEIGDGWYGFDFSPSVDVPMVGVIDGGFYLDNRDRYVPVDVHPYDHNLDRQLSTLGITALEIAQAVLEEVIADHEDVDGSLAQAVSVLFQDWSYDDNTNRFIMKKPDGTTFVEFNVTDLTRTRV